MAKKWEKWLEKDNLVLLQGWARDGLSMDQIAHNCGVTRQCFYGWIKKPECEPIKKAVEAGKEVVDYVVENALLKKAMAGDVTAMIFWLKNRKPKQWRDRIVELNDEELTKAKEILGNINSVIDNAD